LGGVGEPALPPADEALILALMAELQEAWRARELPRYLGHFAPEADLVNRAGAWYRGTGEIAQQLGWLVEHGSPGLFAMRTSVEGMRPVAPGVVTVHQRREEVGRASLATYLLVKREGRWRVESVAIAPIEAPRGPRPGG
jgi:uncharacterized protein (TIGR02246 family)